MIQSDNNALVIRMCSGYDSNVFLELRNIPLNSWRDEPARPALMKQSLIRVTAAHYVLCKIK